MSIISLEHAARQFLLPNGDTLPVLNDVSLTVEAGEVVAIIGRSGSGKSTLMNLLGLIDTPDAGRLSFRGTEISRFSDRRRARLRGAEIGFVFQQFHLLEGRSALDNVMEPCLYGSFADFRHREDRARELLAAVGLAERIGATSAHLSGGEQQRVAIARALVRNPALILADEPTGSLDQETGERVLNILLTMAREQQCAVVLVTHDQQIAARANRVLVLEEGVLQ